MLGPIFQNFEAFVTDSLGEDAWEEVILRSELSEPDAAYSSLGMYPDSDLSALLNASVEISGLEASVLLERFGIFLLMRFSERFPAFFESSDGVISFLTSVDRHIHVQVRKLYPEAVTPSVLVQHPPDGPVIIAYSSERKLCALARGMIKGAIDYYNRSGSVEEVQCMHNGADQCLFELRLDS